MMIRFDGQATEEGKGREASEMTRNPNRINEITDWHRMHGTPADDDVYSNSLAMMNLCPLLTFLHPSIKVAPLRLHHTASQEEECTFGGHNILNVFDISVPFTGLAGMPLSLLIECGCPCLTAGDDRRYWGSKEKRRVETKKSSQTNRSG